MIVIPAELLISPSDLAPHLDDPDWAVVDCRFALGDQERGRRDYLQGHIPGAVYAHLDDDLSGPIVPGVTGRHPLPPVSQAAAVMGKLGIDEGVQVVTYDDAGGALAAARLWWMLRWLGHEAAAVLDGGWRRWAREGRPAHAGEESRPARLFIPNTRPELVASAEEVEALRLDPMYRLLDARSAERYRGEAETVDPVAGHIPGAANLPYTDNLTPEGNLRPAEELRLRFQALLGEVPSGRVVHYCGSGATAGLNILAMLHAGLGEGRLYAGSWSEWITDAERPIGKGEGE
jgi:thiosulfate/3-mercaptopyruvate sulfurtransferase